MSIFDGSSFRLLRERELEDKIRKHTLSMQGNRGISRGTPQEEMLAAKRELKVVSIAELVLMLFLFQNPLKEIV